MALTIPERWLTDDRWNCPDRPVPDAYKINVWNTVSRWAHPHPITDVPIVTTDGDDHWAFFFHYDDTTGYIHANGSIEFYGAVSLINPPDDDEE